MSSNSQNPADSGRHEILSGGTERVSFGNPAAVQQRADKAGLDSYQEHGGQTIDKQQLRAEMWDAPAPSSDPILQGAKTPFGSTSTKFEDRDVVVIDGLQVTIGQALQHGLLFRDASGRLTSAPEGTGLGKPGDADQSVQPQAKAQEQQQQNEEVLEAEPFVSTEDLLDVKAAGEVIHGEVLEQATKHLAAAIRAGKEEVDLRYMAAEAGMDPEVFADAFSKMYSGFHNQAAAYVERETGIPFSEAAAVWRQSDAEALSKAMYRHVQTQNPKAYAPLVDRLKQVLKAGPVVAKEPADPWVYIPESGGMKMRRSAALKAGYYAESLALVREV